MADEEFRVAIAAFLRSWIGQNFSLGDRARNTLRIWLTRSSTAAAPSRKYFGHSTTSTAGIRVCLGAKFVAIIEGVAKGEIVEITNVHAGAVHIVEMIAG
jgi:hypothetical protein